MLNFPPPPPPPIDASHLENLADYYRSMVDYYRRASTIAERLWRRVRVGEYIHLTEEHEE